MPYSATCVPIWDGRCSTFHPHRKQRARKKIRRTCQTLFVMEDALLLNTSQAAHAEDHDNVDTYIAWIIIPSLWASYSTLPLRCVCGPTRRPRFPFWIILFAIFIPPPVPILPDLFTVYSSLATPVTATPTVLVVESSGRGRIVPHRAPSRTTSRVPSRERPRVNLSAAGNRV